MIFSSLLARRQAPSRILSADECTAWLAVLFDCGVRKRVRIWGCDRETKVAHDW